jgi:CRISPR-associated endoribonuclease Cas6
MRLKIRAVADKPFFIPLNYQYQLHSIIYKLIRESSQKYAEFLHEEGFRWDNHSPKRFKLFTFSQLKVKPYCFTGDGFDRIRTIEFVYSTAAEKNFEHLVYGLFAKQELCFRFGKNTARFLVQQVESLPEPQFTDSMKFSCLSPITVSTKRERIDGTGLEVHFLDYLNPAEKSHFCRNLFLNLTHKYQTLFHAPYGGDNAFEFQFDPEYLIKRQGRISKLIRFKDDIKIKAFEAPFTMRADPALIRIGYQCGFGEKNSDGFGCVEMVKTDTERR